MSGLADAQKDSGDGNSERKIALIRQWVVLIVGILLIVYALIAPSPAALMVGSSLVGGSPLDAARAAPPR